MTLSDTADYKAFVAGIVADPGNDLRRLVFADFLEENGESERAEFIRLQIERAAWEQETGVYDIPLSMMGREHQIWLDNVDRWFPFKQHGHVMLTPPNEAERRNGHTVCLLRRGFVAEVYCPLSWWMGVKCRHCRDGRFGYPPPDVADCPACNSSGYQLAANGPRLVKEQPIETVTLTDVTWDLIQDREAFFCLAGVYWRGRVGEMGGIPAELWDCLEGGERYAVEGMAYEGDVFADRALSDACIKWAKGHSA